MEDAAPLLSHGRRILQSGIADKATAYGVTTEVILANLAINLFLCFLCACVFSAAGPGRPWLYRVYSPRLTYKAGETLEEPRSWNPVQWAWQVWSVPEDRFMKSVGLDALMYIKTAACFARVFIIGSVVGTAGLVPLNANSQIIEDSVDGGAYSFARFTISNVPEKSGLLWYHVVFAYAFTITAVVSLRFLFLDYIRLRHLYLLRRSPQQHTVMLHHIPKPLQSATAMSAFFDRIFPGQVANVAIVLRLPKLAALIREYKRAKAKLEAALAACIRDGGRRPRLTCVLRDGVPVREKGLLDACAPTEEKDAIRFWHNRCETLRARVELRREECATWHANFERTQAGDCDSDCDTGGGGEGEGRGEGQGQSQGQGEGEGAARAQGEAKAPQGDALPRAAEEQPLLASPASRPRRAASSTLPTYVRSRIGAAAERGAAAGGGAFDADLQPAAAGGAASRLGALLAGVCGGPEEGSDAELCCACIGGRGRGRVELGGWRAEWARRASPQSIQRLGSRAFHFVLGNPLSSTAFVTFYSLAAAGVARSYHGPLHPTPSAMLSASSAGKADWSVADADAAAYTPEPRELLWRNVCVTWQRRPLQGLAGQAFAFFVIVSFVTPVVFISAFANVQYLREHLHFVDELVVDSRLLANALALVAPLLLLWLVNLVPPAFALFQRFVSCEARSISENQALVFRRYFTFLFYNVFLLLALSTTASETVFAAIDDPREAVTRLGVALPKASAFYVQYIVVRTFAGLGFELARLNRYLLAAVKFLLAGPDLTPEQRERPIIGCRSLDRPGPFAYGRYYAESLIAFVLAFAYGPVAPLIIPAGALYFAGAAVVYKRQLAYVYEKEYEVGGALWPGVQRRCILGILTSHGVLASVLAAKLAWRQVTALLPLPVLTLVAQQFMERVYGSAARALPLAVAGNEDGARDGELGAAGLEERFGDIRDSYTQPELIEELTAASAELRLAAARAANPEATDPDEVLEVPADGPADGALQPERRRLLWSAV